MVATILTSLHDAITSFFRKIPLQDHEGVPRHIAIIMDGNRRWARKKGVPTKVGHWKGADALNRITEFASDMGVKTLTVYSFSTENWTRPNEEVSDLMHLFSSYLQRMRKKMIKEGVKLSHIGDVSAFPQSLQKLLKDVEQETSKGSGINLVLALNYGSRNEVVRAVKEVAKKIERGELSSDEITESLIGSHMDTARFGDPDLLIRTSGEMRLSNFLLWQLSYTELYITEQLWPDFSNEDFVQAIETYKMREVRRGS